MAVIFNSVTWFEIQPERTKTRVKRDDLDTLTEIFTGPSVYEDIFVPANGSVHSSYNLMTVISTSIRRMPADVSEITVNYHGKLDNSGASGYTSIPTISKSWMEGEVSYQVSGSAGYTQMPLPGSGFGPLTYTQLGIVTYSRRYTGRCVSLAYVTNRVPTGEPTQIGFAKSFLGFQNIWDTMTGFSAGMVLSGAGSTIEKMACTDVRVEDRADGWYRVTEMYQSRMFPGAAGYQFAPPSASAPAPPKNISSNTAPPNTSAQIVAAAWSAESTYAAATAALAQSPPGVSPFSASERMPDGSALVVTGSSLPASDSGSVGANTAIQTGMDPVWADDAAYTSASQAGTLASDSSAEQGYASPLYDG